MPNQYLVTLPLVEMPIGTEYPSGNLLPLHCTIMQWFWEGKGFDLLELEYELSALASRVRKAPLVLESSHLDHFGSHNDIRVHVLQRNESLNLFHTELLLQLAKMNSVPDDLRWVGAGYRAHVTVVPRGMFSPGQRYTAQQIVLLERDESRIRKVVSAYDIRPTNS